MSKDSITIKNLKTFLALFSIFYFLFSISLPVQAQGNLMENLVINTPLVNTELVSLVFNVIRYVLGFLGVVAVVVLIYGGFLWMTARGNEEQVQKAKKTLINGLIGLIVVILSFAIVSFVMNRIRQSAQPPTPSCDDNNVGQCWNCQRCVATATGYAWVPDNSCPGCAGPPPSGQFMHLLNKFPTGTNAILCWVVQATFSEDLNCETVNSDNIKLKIKNGASAGAGCTKNKDCASGLCSGTPSTCQGNQVSGGFDCSANSFSFDPTNDFEIEATYEVEITAGLRSENNRSLLPSQRKWEFITGDQGDPSPPTVLQVYPSNNSTNVCRLAPVQAKFSEVMNVTTLCRVNDTDPTKNSLNTSPVYNKFNCFVPSLDSFSAQPNPQFPYNGITQYTATLNSAVIKDACNNPLTADYQWSFTTHPTNTSCLPRIDSIAGNPYYGEELTISGTDFTLTGNIIFSRNLYADAKCFDTNKIPNQVCLTSWSGNKIEIKIPAANGDSNGAVSGPIWVRVNDSYSPGFQFNIFSPYIESISPTNGGLGQAVTIYGQNFGTYSENNSENNRVGLVKVSPSYSWTNAVLPCEAVGWQNDKIIIQIPSDLSLGTYLVQVKDANGRYSNLVEFQVNNNPAGPILCDITPRCPNGQIGGKKNDSRTLSGQRFASTDKIYFNDIEVSPSPTSSTTTHTIIVPNLSPKTYSVKIKNAGGHFSNPLNFISPCLPQGNVGAACFLNSTTCGPNEMCVSPYKCVSDGATPPNECRCCCAGAGTCPTGLTCDQSQICYENPTTGIEVKGRCCGCSAANPCPTNEICKNNCCYTCALGDEGQSCTGGQCCARNCAEFTTQTTCQAQQGCSWKDNACTGRHSPYCCQGRCVNYQCLILCGNNQIDPGEQCDGNNLGGKTCQALGFAGGTLACQPDCTFDTTGCFTAGGPGRWGDKCQLANVCTEGAADCSLAQGATCVRNVTTAPCACCCDLGNDSPTTDTCSSLNLVCDETKNCGTTGQTGLCCGCGTDDDKCCQNPPCIGVACKDNCCLPFPAPTNLEIIDPTVNQIKLKWQYSDSENLATHFEIYRKIDNGNYLLLTTCETDNLACDPSNNFSLTRSGNNYTFVDTTGEFDRTRTYYFKVRAKKGTETAYSDYTNEVSGTPLGVVTCNNNNDCPDRAPCCRTDTGQCVTWDLCNFATNGNCVQDPTGGRCRIPEAKFALADFWVQPPPVIAGPCLLDVQPRQGYVMETRVNLTGLTFGDSQGNSNVLFNNTNANYTATAPNVFSWSDTKIQNVRISNGTSGGLGEVKVRRGTNDSNSLAFRVLTRQGQVGDQCKKTEVLACTTGFDQCQNPPNQNTYSCLPRKYCATATTRNGTSYSFTDQQCNQNSDCSQGQTCQAKDDCRCCCDPNNNQCPSPLVCTANMGDCTGPSRGLCCGCTNDTQCGTNLGCGILDPNKCCYPRPSWQGSSFCDDSNLYDISTNSEDVRLNTDITLTFSTKMDFTRLNENYIKISREGTPEFTDECQPIGNRCYLYHRAIRSQNISTNTATQTKTIFSPRRCRLQPDTEYKIEIVVGNNGEGIRSEKGVSIGTVGASNCSWDNTKKCLFQTFKTSDNKEALCQIQWIDVQPRGPVIVRDINIATTFDAFAWDNSRPTPRSVCVENFNWESSNPTIASVTTPGLSTTAISKGLGEAKIIASLPAPVNKTCNTSPHTCGLLRISLAGPQVIENQGCAVCAEGGQSPSPFKNSTEACRNALIVAKFNRAINAVNLDLPNVFIVENGQTGDFNRPGSFSEVSGSYQSIFDGTNNVVGFQFKPDSQLAANKIYRVTLRSGPQGIKDINGLQLDGNKNGVQDGSPADDYVWYFKTGNNANCLLDKVCVQPNQAKITHLATQGFTGEVYANNCNYLDPTGYTWTWMSSVVESFPIPTSGSVTVRLKRDGETCSVNSDCESNNCDTQNNKCVDASRLPTNTVKFKSTNLGQAEIKGSVGDKEDKARLIVATSPTIVEKYPPNQNNICRNTAISITFDQLMDHTSLNSSTIKLWRQPLSGETNCNPEIVNLKLNHFVSLKNKFSFWFEKFFFKKTEAVGSSTYTSTSSCATSWCGIVETNYQLEIRDLSNPNRTQVLLKPNQPLSPDLCYKVEIEGVKSRQPFSETMTDSYSWQFKTGSEICLLDRVEVDADTTKEGIQNKWTFNRVEPQNFKAIPLARNGQEISSIVGSYTWVWSWLSSDSSVAIVGNTDNQTQTVTPQPKNGLATITAKATITSHVPNIPSGEKSGSALAEVFLCENPWPCKTSDWPNCQPYQDTTTNFEFRYCRDTGPAGIEGDLPILKGGVVAGATETEKIREHLFSVYDGSLSFYYEGETVINNLSGYNNPDYNLYLNNPSISGSISSVSGKFGQALSFGQNAYLEINDNITLKPQTLTLAAWIVREAGVEKYLFRKGDTGPTGQGYNLKISTDDKVYLWIYDKNGDKKQIISTDAIDDPSLWTHLAATYDGQKLKIYINGVLKGETSASGIKYEGNIPLRVGDSGLLLDEIALYTRALTQPEIEKLTKEPVQPVIGDVIGFKVFSNFDHLRPGEWFKKYAPGATGSPAPKTVDGYRAVQVGRTIYVGATNVTDANNIYSNIYLISHNDNPKPETLEVFRKIVENWRFNTNKNNSGEYLISQENKGKLARDLERLYHLNDIAPLFERYKNKKGYYPKLEAGSYIIGMTTSKWPSWNRDPAFNLAKELEGSLPLDPINEFANRTTKCGQDPNKYDCCADCPSNNPQCQKTCYNSARKTCSSTTTKICLSDLDCPSGEICKINPIYECNSGSHIYQYMVENNGGSYSFYSKFEYSNPNKWQHQCSRFLTSQSCQTSHWCEWRCGSLEKCYDKNLYYEGDPCSSPSTCEAFNSKYRPSVHSQQPCSGQALE